jgi:SAM-dependent methyltransferase
MSDLPTCRPAGAEETRWTSRELLPGLCSLVHVRDTIRGGNLRHLPGYWFDYRPKQLNQKGAQAVLESAKKAARVDLRVQRLVALLGTLRGKLILEVGAGGGEFLSAVRYAGADVIANEISSEACDFLERVLHIPVVRGELAEAPWDFDSPDVIVMSDLVEHPIEPFRLLSRAVSLLKQGGRLVIWTPNGGGAGQEPTTAECWVGFRVDLEHLQYFSPRTIQVLAGF